MQTKRLIVMYGGKERLVEVDESPFKLFSDDKLYYDGWLMPEGCDPYGEPRHITFTADSIVRELE